MYHRLPQDFYNFFVFFRFNFVFRIFSQGGCGLLVVTGLLSLGSFVPIVYCIQCHLMGVECASYFLVQDALPVPEQVRDYRSRKGFNP